tara:strand:+ start:23347 stop:24903 length:1557 start_codon:yes stop_codon:yes gene_type:complete
MSLQQISNLCQIIEDKTPTETVKIISENLSSFEDKPSIIKILSLEYANNNMGSKKSIKWISGALGLFEDEIEYEMNCWGDMGEALYVMYEGENKSSGITISEFISLLEMDCASQSSPSYVRFSEALNKMSALEKKWFVRYWLRKPRNGINNKIPLKVLAKYYTNSNIMEYYKYNCATDICLNLEAGTEPECKLVHGQFINPMLAKARKGKEKPSKYIIDIKYDGNRYQIHKATFNHGSSNDSTSIIIFNRKGKVVTNQFPDVVEQVAYWDYDLILDTEIYPINIDGSPAEHKLMAKRVHKLNKAEAVQQCPVKMVVFDLLSINNTPLINQQLRERVRQLREFVPKDSQAIIFDEDTTIEAAYNIAINEGFEGVMIKDASLAYEPGKRSKGWLKYKPPRVSLDVVITSGKYGEGKRSGVFGTLGISVLDGDEYVSVGSVGTGLSEAQLFSLTTTLKKNVDSYEGDTFHFLPRVVLEVSADLVSQDEQGNYGLRFPRVKRIREDKFPKEVDNLTTVMEMI